MDRLKGIERKKMRKKGRKSTRMKIQLTLTYNIK